MNPEENKIQKPIKALRTYQGDVEEALSKTKSSTATIMIAEEKRREERPELAPQRRVETGEKNRLYLVLSSILLVLAISVVGGVYYLRSNEDVVVNKKEKPLVSATKEIKLKIDGLSGDQAITRIISERDSFNLQANSILFLNTINENDEPLPAQEIISKISPRIPQELARTFDGKYMIGIYSFDTNAPFIIIKTSDYSIGYSGMLKWEKDITKDLGKFFNVPQNIIGAGITFVDEAYKNKDLRILVDNNNKTVLLYSFVDKNTIIITTDENVFSAILGKYIISQETK